MNLARRLVSFVTLALLLISTDQQPARAQTSQKVSIAVLASDSTSEAWVALDRGTFKQAGLDVRSISWPTVRSSQPRSRRTPRISARRILFRLRPRMLREFRLSSSRPAGRRRVRPQPSASWWRRPQRS